MSKFKFSEKERNKISNAIDDYSIDYDMTEEQFIYHIEQIVSERDGWIDVDDRLPEIKDHIDYQCSDNVFAVFDGNVMIMAYCVVDGFKVWCNCYHDIDGDPLNDDDYAVTHWQPLPSPPKQPTK